MADKKYTVDELMERLTWAGVEPGESLDDFKKNLNSKYFTEDTFFESEAYKKKIGSINGSLLSKTKAISKQFGIELAKDDIGDKKTEEIFELALSKLQEKNNSIQKELEEKAGKNTDENLKALTSKFEKLQSDYSTIENANKNLKQTFEQKEAEYANNIKSEKINFRKKDMWGNFKWGTDNEMVKRGFQSVIDEKYDFDLDDNDNLIPLDKKTKAKIPNPKSNTAFLGANEILESEGVAAKVYKLNPDGGKKPEGQHFFQQQQPPAEGAKEISKGITQRSDGRVLVTGNN